MIKKVKFFVAIIILTAIAATLLIVSGACLAGALQTIKSGGAGGVVGGVFILVLFALTLGLSALFAVIDLPFTIISVKKSEAKIFPIIALSIDSLIIIIGIIFLILVVVNIK